MYLSGRGQGRNEAVGKERLARGRGMKKSKNIRSFAAKELRVMKAQSKTDLRAFDAMTDEELERRIEEHPDEKDLCPDWTKAKLVLPKVLLPSKSHDKAR